MVDALSFAATAIAAILLRTKLGPDAPPERADRTFWTDLGGGRFVWRNGYLRFVAG